VEFRVEACDQSGKVGEGSHERAIVNVERFAARMAAKRERT
jgi:predicted thioesterase